MKIAIIADVHNNTVNLKKVLDYCQKEKIGTIICCGDLASIETLDFLSNNFSGVTYYTFGNMDNDQLKNQEGFNEHPNIFIHQGFGETEIDGTRIAFTHFPSKARDLCESGKYSFVFYGHTHRPWEEKVGTCLMLNPGNVAGEIYPPTFAVWDKNTGKFDLLRIHELK